MPLVTRKFGNYKALNAFYLGKIRGGADLSKLANALFLHGKTLIFTTPAGTVTFAASPAAAQNPMKLSDVKVEIEAQVATVKAEIVDYALQLWTATPGTIVLSKDGTANSFFGFDTAVDTTAKIVAVPGGAAPKFIALAPGYDGSLFLTTED